MIGNMSSEGIYIGLGANLPRNEDTPAQTILAAIKALDGEDLRITRVSSLWQSPAWPDPSKPGYVNAVAEVSTRLSAHALLQRLLEVELVFGRERHSRWDSRTLDLDLIDYEGQIIRQLPGLILPHPRARDRAFVLLPLAEIAPDWREPESGASIGSLIADLKHEDVTATSKL